MELVFVRHGQPERVIRHDGQPADPPLSSIGQQQAAAVAGWLLEVGIDALYSSPMRRAQQTASAISEATGLVPTVRAGLSEFDRDSPAYVPMEVLKKTDRKRWDELATGSFGDAERATHFIATVNGAVDQIVAGHRSQRVALACHGGVVNAYLARCLGFDPDAFLKFDVDYTSVTRVFASSRGHRSVLSVNERTHLRGRPDLAIGL
ncbi:histidine phosphatase family protein [Candidatus Poriferisodalis sp.]|uniref:histidine phosphatase family protein n=1 Tax=Candidatus Poriferisodalis sp. TaxID=3101277 RepID=UPI003B021FBC